MVVWASQLASTTGDRLYAVALVWVALRISGSPTDVALVSLADTAPFLATGMISGWVADRYDGLRLARVVDALRAAAVALVPLCYVTGRLGIGELAAVAAILSGLEAFFVPALQASVPRLVRPREVPAMISLLDSTDRLGRILGPGVIAAVSFVPEIHFFTTDAVSFVASALCLTLVIGSATGAPAAGRLPLSVGELLAGWRATLGVRELRIALALRGITNIAWPAFTVSTPFLIEARHLGVATYGLLLAAFGAGNIPGTVLAARVPRAVLLRTCCLAWAAAGAGFVVLAAVANVPGILLAGAGIGVCTPLANVTVNATVAARLPSGLLARAYAVQRLVVVGGGVIGLPIVGALTATHGATITIVGAGCLITIAGLIALLLSETRRSEKSHSPAGRVASQ